MTTEDDFHQLLARLRPRLRSYALRLCNDRHDAEDLLQRSCLRALERPHQLRPNTTPLHWMISIMHTTWINELRSRKIRGRSRVEWNDMLIDTIADTVTPSPEQNLMMRQAIEAVARLPATQQTVMVLVVFEGFSYGEAAERLGVPVGTIMSRLSRARRMLARTSASRTAGVSVLRSAVGK
ncbi:RNA polymerase sigma factor [Paraburkholderia flava]|uniref:RNA polymerase sigma factor n=1 Tax=Paraburkholderia flava TaxID=2547393 RepID=UPI0010611E1A|nr:RNA polymerase sigma factor [Paraburkholderia flava]